MSGQDFYAILGVQRRATSVEIKRAYRQLARELHPDRNPSEDAEERFKRAAKAYAVLSDPKKRRRYDQLGEAGLGSAGNPDDAPGFRDMFKGSVGDLLGSKPRRPSRRQGKNIEARIRIAFREMLEGTEREVTVRANPKSPPRRLKVKVPAGIKQGGKIRLRGQGVPGPRGGSAGDVVLTVDIEPHAHFSRDGEALVLRLPITPLEAYEGAKVPVQTPAGTVQLSVPQGSGTGTKLRLRGKGVPVPEGRGDLIVRLEVALPKQRTTALHEALGVIEAAFDGDVRTGVHL